MLVQAQWPKLNLTEPFLNWVNLLNHTMFRVMIFKTNGFPYHARAGMFVAIERCGSFFFNTHSILSGAYVGEKLGIPISDANIIADLLNAQIFDKFKQQGEYDPAQIMDEGYQYSDEYRIMPLHPIIKPQ